MKNSSSRASVRRLSCSTTVGAASSLLMRSEVMFIVVTRTQVHIRQARIRNILCLYIETCLLNQLRVLCKQLPVLTFRAITALFFCSLHTQLHYQAHTDTIGFWSNLLRAQDCDCMTGCCFQTSPPPAPSLQAHEPSIGCNCLAPRKLQTDGQRCGSQEEAAT